MFEYLYPNKTCVLIHENKIIYESTENGVKPLIKFIHYNGTPNKNTILIDKIIGLAIANIVLYCNINTVYTKIISKPALELLSRYNINIQYESLVENILSRDKSDICPLEKKVSTATSPTQAYAFLHEIVINNNPIHLM